MKSDVNGCSTCPRGEERWEPIKMPHNKRVNGVQYDYRHTDGELFSCVALNLALAQEKRDKWLENKNSNSQK